MIYLIWLNIIAIVVFSFRDDLEGVIIFYSLFVVFGILGVIEKYRPRYGDIWKKRGK